MAIEQFIIQLLFQEGYTGELLNYILYSPLFNYYKKEWVLLLSTILTFSNIANVASIIGLVLSIFIIYNTKNIKSNLKLIGRFKQFNTDKKTILVELESSLDLIIKDGINDLKNSSDISRSLSKLSHYKDFMTLSHKWTLKRINKLLANKDGINKNNKAALVMLLSKLNGFLELKQEYIKEIS